MSHGSSSHNAKHVAEVVNGVATELTRQGGAQHLRHAHGVEKAGELLVKGAAIVAPGAVATAAAATTATVATVGAVAVAAAPVVAVVGAGWLAWKAIEWLSE